ncbi:uncharacterized protein LOC128998509 [Macrosteles quadrilineatus]|nr:uncharacterized protein LOC128998509 [Macrosteles quadrilineatus]
MCKYHENFFFLFQKCKQYKLINHSNMNDLVSSICCSVTNKTCVYRECDTCKSTKIAFNENCDTEWDSKIHHFEWKNVTEERVKNGVKRMVKVTRKVKIFCTLEELKEKLCSQILLFMTHKFRVYNQNKFSKYCRTNLNDDEVFVVFDFSENYQLKYSSEVQSRHFGASNEQLTLHTGAYFVKVTSNDKSIMKVRTFCTVSSCNRHDAAAIWAHLYPIFMEIKQNYENVSRVHIISDGPTKQYRNKSNMYLFSYYMEHFGFEKASYNFSEAGHGKSVADGVGGTIKRTADSAVNMGKDVSNLEQFMTAVSNLKIQVLEVDEAKMKSVDSILKPKLVHLRAIKDTLKLHQIVWNSPDGTGLDCRFLSCIICRNKSKCPHQMTSYHSLITEAADSAPSTSIPRTETSIATCRRERLSYHDVYSDDDDHNETVQNPSVVTPCELPSDEVNDLSTGDFVLVRFPLNKIVKFYIGEVIQKYKDGDYEVKFLRKTVGEKFVFPQNDDIASVNIKDIIQTLTNFKMHRGIYIFQDLAKTSNVY